MSKTDKILTSEYLDWHAKLSGLPSVLTEKIRSNLYKKYKKDIFGKNRQTKDILQKILKCLNQLEDKVSKGKTKEKGEIADYS